MEEKKPIVGPPGGFLPRLAASVLDVLFMIFLFIVIGLPIFFLLSHLFHALEKGSSQVLLAIALFLGIPCLYFTLFTGIGGQTFGKKAFNLKVAAQDGQPVGLFRSFLRWFCSLFSGLFLLSGYLIAVFQKDKKSLHDLLTGTKVVQVAPYNQTFLTVFLCAIPIGGFFMVPVIGILAAIAIPRYAQMLEKSREGATKGNLGALKSAASIYYGDHNGKWPSNLEKDLVPKYIDAIPPVKATGAFVAGAQSPVGNNVAMAKQGEVPSGSGSGWLYDSALGKVYVNSTVHDSKKVPYSFYGFE